MIVDALKALAVPIDSVRPDPRNARVHPPRNLEALRKSLEHYGQRKPIVVNRSEGNRIIAGNGLWQAAKELGWTHIAAVFVEDDPATATGYALMDNQSALLAEWDFKQLDELIEELQEKDFELELTGFDLGDIADIGAENLPKRFDVEIEEVTQDPRIQHVDLIFTVGVGTSGRAILVMCCLAVKVGWLYGFNSSGSPCGAAYVTEAHHPQFIDNDYFNYDHEVHLAAVKRWRPKYATVRDVMSPGQCRRAGIKYYSLEQILDWAEEIAEYAENVIVIPKYDCIDQIPEKYVLGYSIPSSHGRTPLPVGAFRGRRVHLLGGGPDAQIQYWSQLRDEVVSLDNNYILKTAGFGRAWTPRGEISVDELCRYPPSRPLYPALVVTLANMAAVFRKGGEDHSIEEEVMAQSERKEDKTEEEREK